MQQEAFLPSCLFFLYTCTFQLRFFASLDVILPCSTNSERLTIEVSEFGKATSKKLNDDEHGQSENEELEAFKELFCHHKYFLKAFFSMDRSYKFLIASFTEKD